MTGVSASELAGALVPAFARLAEAAYDVQIILAKLGDVPAGGSLKRTAGASAAALDDLPETVKLTKKQKRELRPPRQPTAFNLFIKSEVAKVRAENPNMEPKAVFSECAARWKVHKAKHGSVAPSGNLAGMSTPMGGHKEKSKKEKSHKKDKKRDK